MKKRRFLHWLIAGLMTLTVPAAAMAAPDQGLMVCVKKDAAANYANADLDGNWYFGSLGLENYETANPEGHTWWGPVLFDSAGAPWTMTVNGTDYDTSIPGSSSFAVDYTFSVNADGVVDFPTTDAGPSTTNPLGYLSANRQYFVGAHGTQWTTPIPNDLQFRMNVAIRQSTAKTNADLNGRYQIRDLEFFDASDAGRSASVVWGVLTFSDPDFSFEIFSYDSDGTTSAQKTGVGTYTVNADGSIVLQQVGEPDSFGQLSADDNVFFISMGRTSSHGPHNAMVVGIKEASGYSNASLSGDYHMAFLVVHRMEDPSRDGELIWGNMSFDGAGNVTNLTLDEFWSDGLTEAATASGTYSLDSGGTVIITLDTIDGQPANPAPEFEGYLSSDGELMALSFTDQGAIGPVNNTNPVNPASNSNSGGGGGGGCFIHALK